MPASGAASSPTTGRKRALGFALAVLDHGAAWFREGRWLGAASVLSVLLAWYLSNALALVPKILLPGPGEVVTTLIDITKNGYRDTTLWQNAMATLWRCVAGFVLACLSGIPLGLAMGYNTKIRAACDYIIQFMRPLPPLSY
jgi:taurine transport system permease protein